MTFTHTFEIIVNGNTVAGEMGFMNGEPPRIKTNTGIEMEVEDLDAFKKLLESFQAYCTSCGEISKIEILLKL